MLRLRREDILLPFWQRPGPGFFQINEAFLEACVARSLPCPPAPSPARSLSTIPLPLSTIPQARRIPQRST